MSPDVFNSDSHSALMRLRRADHLVNLWKIRVRELNYSHPAKLRLQQSKVQLEEEILKLAEFQRVDVASSDDLLTVLQHLTRPGIARPHINILAGTLDSVNVMDLAHRNGFITSTDNPVAQIILWHRSPITSGGDIQMPSSQMLSTTWYSPQSSQSSQSSQPVPPPYNQNQTIV